MSSGILLVGHGTRDDAGAGEFQQLAQQLRQRESGRPVEACFLELRPPTIEVSWQRLVKAGARHIDVAPLLLFAAGHAKRDVPAEIQRVAAESAGISYDFARPLSRHPQLIELAVERAQQAWSARQVDLVADRTVLVMVGRGSYDPCAQADMRVLAELVGHRLPFANVATAFYAMAQPTLPDLLDQLAESRQFDALIVQPHLLFAGQVRDGIARQVAEARHRHPRRQFILARHLGPDPRLAAAVAGRIEETRLSLSQP